MGPKPLRAARERYCSVGLNSWFTHCDFQCLLVVQPTENASSQPCGVPTWRHVCRHSHHLGQIRVPVRLVARCSGLATLTLAWEAQWHAVTHSHTRPHTPSQSLSSQWLASRDTLRAIPVPCSTVRRTLLRWQGGLTSQYRLRNRRRSTLQTSTCSPRLQRET